MENQIKVKSTEFLFCRIGVMLIVWFAWFFKIRELVLLSFIILLLTAIFTIKYAPMFLIWRYTFGFFVKSKEEFLNVKAMRFAHTLGSIFSGICVFLLYFGFEKVGWIATFIFAIMKTTSALGFCPASKLYSCMSEGTCCAFARKFKRKNKK